MIYDESSKEYKPRWGYKGINSGVEDHAIIEVKSGQDPFKDPWESAREEKKKRVTKNAKNQLGNIFRSRRGSVTKESSQLFGNTYCYWSYMFHTRFNHYVKILLEYRASQST